MSREERRSSHENQEKKVRQLLIEKDNLWERRRRLGYTFLEEPIRDGWIRILELDSKVDNHPKRKEFQYVIDNFQRTYTSKRKDFKLTKKEIRWNKQTIPHIKDLHEHEYKSLTEFQKGMFMETYRFNRWANKSYKEYIFIRDWAVKVKTKKNYITKVRVFDSSIDKRIDEIDEYIERNGLWNMVNKVQHWGSHDRYWSENEMKRVKEAKRVDAELWKERKGWDTQQTSTEN